MKKIVLLNLVLFCTSCFVQKGQWIDGQCRPKNPNFKILKIPFKETDKLVFKNIYKGVTIASFGLGFYDDGRLMWLTSSDGYELKDKDVFDKNWINSQTIGYWRLKNNKIKIEFFICRDGGYYYEKQGEIKGDTIIFYKNIYHPTRKEVREEKYILSHMSF